MNKILTTFIGTSLLAGALYAGQHTSNGCNAHSQCQSSMKKDNGSCNINDSKVSKTAVELVIESFEEDERFGEN